MAKLSADLQPAPEVSDAVAVIGLGCRFPGGVDSPAAYWQLLRRGIDAIREIPADRWTLAEYYDPNPQTPGKMYVRQGGFVDGIDGFDAPFFGIAPREVEDLDPQHRWLLEVAWESLEHAGIAPDSLRGSDAGVFVGMSSDDFAANRYRGNRLTDIATYATLGAARSVAAGRIAYLLDVHGPVVQLDTSCSSSLVAVYQACQALATEQCSLAIAGGVNAILSPAAMVSLCRLTVLAADGRCKTFDAAADGYVRGEGCGLVVLKRLRDAAHDGDRVLAVIRAAAVNHDGRAASLTTPSAAAQQQLMRKTLLRAGIQGHEVSYVEAHGTGTKVGDPIELEAINAVYGAGRPTNRPLYVGSVKTNIGHLEAAAGIAGLIKVVLMLQHGEIPPHLHLTRPNPDIPWHEMPLQVPTGVVPWPDSGPRRLAAVSSFGISGTNAHVVLEAAADDVTDGMLDRDTIAAPASLLRPDGHGDVTYRETAAVMNPTRYLLPLSAHSDESLVALADKYATHIAAHPQQDVADICFTAATGRKHFSRRLAVVAASREELASGLSAFARGEESCSVKVGESAGNGAAVAKIGFLFTGQGSQYAGMGRELYDSQPVFRAALERCARWLCDETNLDLIELLYGATESARRLDRTVFTQPALFSLQFALAELWQSWGVRPDAVMGHSLGEYAAACAAGVFGLETGLQLVAARGRLMGELPETGAMAVVMAGEARVRTALEPFHERLSIAAMNGPETIVISGDRPAVDQLIAQLAAEGIDAELLNTSNAGHSALVDPILERFRAAASRCEYAAPRVGMISNVTGEFAGPEIADGEYWVRHIRAPVQFAQGMQALARQGCRVFIEIGPHPSLLAMGMGCSKGLRPRPLWLPSLTKERSDWDTLLYSLASLYTSRTDIDWQGFCRPYCRTRVSLPTYAFQRTSYPVSAGPLAASADQCLDRSPLPSPTTVAAKVESLRAGLEDEASRLNPRLDEIALHMVIAAIEQIGFVWEPGAELTECELQRRIPSQNHCKVTRVLDRLVQRGWLERAPDRYRIRQAAPTGNAAALLATLQREAVYPECELLGRAGAVLADIWKGEAEPLEVLFPDGATEKAVAFYSDARLLAGYNRIAAAALREATATLTDGEALRVLEVGAGTGGMTKHLLPELPPGRSNYLFTDVSPLFLNAARERFRDVPFLDTQMLDISRSPEEQGLAAQSFDVVVAANVLHATAQLRDTLRHVRWLLKPGGWLMLLEGANPPFWGDVVFTLIDGWWNFQDHDLRPDYPLMRRDAWRRVLAETGFADVACLEDLRLQADSSNTLYLAQCPRSFEPGASFQPGSRFETTGPVRAATRPRPVTAVDVPRTSAAVPAESIAERAAENGLLGLVREHAARVMRMQRERIDATQPLAELGLDSLMATELRAQLGQALGRELALNTLQLRRSIQEIAAFIREEPSLDTLATLGQRAELEVTVPRAHLVPLQPHGTKPPLFFIPAGYGDLFAFQDVAHAMGLDQPVYGLQPASAKHMKTFRQMSVFRLVSAYIDEIKKVQPAGPYYLSGYSAGGIIVVELARELKRQGNAVGLLAIFDPPSHVPFWLDWFYAINYRIATATRLTHLVRRFQSKFARRLFHTILDEGLRTHSAVIREHRVARYPGPIVHFRSRLSQSSLVSMKPMGWFWRRIATEGTEVHWIPGTHYGMLRGRGATVVVDELRDCLQRAAASRTSFDNSTWDESP